MNTKTREELAQALKDANVQTTDLEDNRQLLQVIYEALDDNEIDSEELDTIEALLNKISQKEEKSSEPIGAKFEQGAYISYNGEQKLGSTDIMHKEFIENLGIYYREGNTNTQLYESGQEYNELDPSLRQVFSFRVAVPHHRLFNYGVIR